MFAVIGFSLYVHAVDTVEHVEVVDVDRPGVGFHRGENVGHRYAGQFHLVAVHIEIKLRNLGLEGGRKPRKFLALRCII